MKIGIFTDLHANLPALEICVNRFKELECDIIVHVGDLIGIGPYPKECMELATSVKNMEFVMGNHDHWYGYGLPHPIPEYMNSEEVDHHRWTHAQIGDQYKDVVKSWKFSVALRIGDFCFNFRHYGLNKEKNWFKQHIKDPTINELDQLFGDVESDIIFYGHNHEANDQVGRSRYVNLGSAGCFTSPLARIGILSHNDDSYELQKEELEFDDRDLFSAFNARKVPARDFIRKVFFRR